MNSSHTSTCVSGGRKVRTRVQIFKFRVIILFIYYNYSPQTQQRKEKANEFIVPEYFVFTDFKKAFDTVRHSTLWDVMKKIDVKNTINSAFRNLYKGGKTEVELVRRHEGSTSGMSHIPDAL